MGDFGAVRGRLNRAGWDEVALAGIADLPWHEVSGILRSAVGDLSFADELQIRALVSEATRKEDMSNRSFALQPVAFHKDGGWSRRYGDESETPLTPLLQWEAIEKQAPKARWPTRFQRKLALMEEGVSREKLEKSERDREVGALATALTAAGLWQPGPEDAGRPGFELACSRFAMGRRLGTLRQHVRNIMKIVKFCTITFGYSWFQGPRDYFDYVAEMLNQPCGRHVPRAMLNTMAFAEQAAEVPVHHRLSKDPGVRNFLNEVEQAKAWATGRIAKKAEPFPIMLALSLEDMVVCERDCLYTRWYAWVKLLKLWAAFRWDDLQGIHASDLHLRSDGVLEGKIRRSKTSGVGKKVEVMVFFIGTDAWIFQEIWLVTGWKIHRQLSEGSGLADRDYLVPKPTPCLNGFRKAMVKYGDALVMTRALLLELRVDIKVGSESARSEEPLLVTSHATAFWSEHSERGTIDTWMQMAGVAPEVRRMVGRWSASQEEGYLRHVEAAVKEAQKAVRGMLSRGPEGQLKVFEDQILASLSKFLLDRGRPLEEVKRQLDRLALPAVGRSQEEQESEVNSLCSMGILSAREGSDAPSPTVVVGSEAEMDEELTESDREGEPGEVKRGDYVFSVLGRSKRRTLHRIGDCWRTPGTHYRDYLWVGGDRPPLGPLDKECKDCFGKRLAQAGVVLDSNTELTDSTSTSEGVEQDESF